jgi:hypothetical protein
MGTACWMPEQKSVKSAYIIWLTSGVSCLVTKGNTSSSSKRTRVWGVRQSNNTAIATLFVRTQCAPLMAVDQLLATPKPPRLEVPRFPCMEVRKGQCALLTLLSLPMSYIYEAPCKSRNFNAVHIWTTDGNAESRLFLLSHSISTLNQCRRFSCVTVVCKHFASFQDYPNYRWYLIR